MAGVITPKHLTVLKFADRTGTPIECALHTVSPGDFTLDQLEAGRTSGGVTFPEEALEVMVRGKLYEYVAGDDMELGGQFTVYHEGELTTGSNRLWDAVTQAGAFASGATADAGGVVWTTDLTVTWVRSSVTVTAVFKSCRLSLSYQEETAGNKMVLKWRTRMGYTVS